MINQRVFHVRQQPEGVWEVMREGFSRPHVLGRTKEEAVALAKRLAKLSASGQVIIHGMGDMEERRYSYQLCAHDSNGY